MGGTYERRHRPGEGALVSRPRRELVMVRGATALVNTRLAVIDLSEAVVYPMANERNDVHLAFNGEIYDHAVLRHELEARGHRFAHSATPRSSSTATRNGGSASFLVSTGCSRLRSSTNEAARSFWHAIAWASSRSSGLPVLASPSLPTRSPRRGRSERGTGRSRGLARLCRLSLRPSSRHRDPGYRSGLLARRFAGDETEAKTRSSGGTPFDEDTRPSEAITVEQAEEALPDGSAPPARGRRRGGRLPLGRRRFDARPLRRREARRPATGILDRLSGHGDYDDHRRRGGREAAGRAAPHRRAADLVPRRRERCCAGVRHSVRRRLGGRNDRDRQARSRSRDRGAERHRWRRPLRGLLPPSRPPFAVRGRVPAASSAWPSPRTLCSGRCPEGRVRLAGSYAGTARGRRRETDSEQYLAWSRISRRRPGSRLCASRWIRRKRPRSRTGSASRSRSSRRHFARFKGSNCGHTSR